MIAAFVIEMIVFITAMVVTIVTYGREDERDS